MRLEIYGQFVVSVVKPNGGWSKGRPIAFIEERDKWCPVDLLIPNGLSERALEQYVAAKFSTFARPSREIRRLDALHHQTRRSLPIVEKRPAPANGNPPPPNLPTTGTQ